MHKRERPFTWPECCKGFSDRSNLLNTQRVHSRDGLFVCPVQEGFHSVLPATGPPAGPHRGEAVHLSQMWEELHAVFPPAEWLHSRERPFICLNAERGSPSPPTCSSTSRSTLGRGHSSAPYRKKFTQSNSLVKHQQVHTKFAECGIFKQTSLRHQEELNACVRKFFMERKTGPSAALTLCECGEKRHTHNKSLGSRLVYCSGHHTYGSQTLMSGPLMLERSPGTGQRSCHSSPSSGLREVI
ncbi:gastrula zinc finger protein XlCGF7.1-like [Narcine bancroftii]|uniref:gastrula zinc finger protein XlCGF7.1-like n=1 Tax=Narcine bancroftii TaxID=1343680 RepID=UPI003831A533